MPLVSNIFEIKAMVVLMFCHTEVYDAMRTLGHLQESFKNM